MSFLAHHFLPFLLVLLGIFSTCRGDFAADVKDTTNLSLGVFIGIVVGVLLGLIALIVLTCFICTCCCFKKKDDFKSKKVESKSRILRSNLSNHSSSAHNYSTGLESPLPQYVGYELEDVPRPFALQPPPPGKTREIPYAKPVVAPGGILKNTQGLPINTNPMIHDYQGRKIPPAVPPKPAYTRNYPQQAAWEEVNKRLKKDFIDDPRNPPLPDY